MPHCVTDPSEGCWLTVVECSECSGSTNKCLWCSTVHSFSVVGPISPPCFIINLHIICITCRCSSSNDVVAVCVVCWQKSIWALWKYEDKIYVWSCGGWCNYTQTYFTCCEVYSENGVDVTLQHVSIGILNCMIESLHIWKHPCIVTILNCGTGVTLDRVIFPVSV